MPRFKLLSLSRMRAASRCLVFVFLICLLGAQARTEPQPASELTELLAATAEPSKAQQVEDETLKRVTEAFSKSNLWPFATSKSDLWPYATFISAELHRQKNELRAALDEYRTLAEWGAENARQSTWGGSSLATFALWRWLTLTDPESNTDLISNKEEALQNAERVLEAANALEKSRFTRELYATLPRLEEDIARRLAALSWSNDRPDSIPLFIRFLGVTYTTDFAKNEQEMYEETLAKFYATKDRLELLRGKRFFKLKEYGFSKSSLHLATKSDDPQVRAESLLYAAKIKNIERKGKYCDVLRAEIIDLDPAIENGSPDVVSEALYMRGMANITLNDNNCEVNERDGSDLRAKREEVGISDLNTLVKFHPDSHRTDDALYQIGRYFQRTKRVGEALKYYARLRKIIEHNDYENFSRARPAWILYARNREGDKKKADKLFEEIQHNFPDGGLYLTALFWRARIASDTGRNDDAQHLFEKIIAYSPYSYYATRARMHLKLGQKASEQLWPDEDTKAELKRAFEASQIGYLQEEPFKYVERLRLATQSGLYREAFTGLDWHPELGVHAPIQDRSLEQLEQTGILTRLAVLLTLRQEAFAAIDSVRGRDAKTDIRLRLAGSIGEKGGDWTTALALIRATPSAHAAEERSNLYLSTAYPNLFFDDLTEAARAFRLPPELLYSIVRYQSSFDPAAVSPAMAFGLFQFIPSTFRKLNEKWGLLEKKYETNDDIIVDMQNYLVESEKSIQLGARFFDSKSHIKISSVIGQEDLCVRNDGDILFSIMAYHGNDNATKSWIKLWNSIGYICDIEYVMDTIQNFRTRKAVREIVGSMFLMNASGIFNPPEREALN